LNSLYYFFWILHQSCLFPFFFSSRFSCLLDTLKKKICVAASRVLTIKILGTFLTTNHVCFLIRYDTLVLMFLCIILKRSVFPPGNNSDSVFSSFLPRFSSFYKKSLLFELLTICSDFFHFFLKLLTLKLSNSSASSGILLPLSTGFVYNSIIIV
jgi:hypothetical protein